VEEFHVLEHWAYLGSARCEEELAALCAAAPAAPDPGAIARGGTARDALARSATAGPAAVFDADVYRILVRYFSNHHNVDCHALPEVVN
jgi:uroporphyrinogen-III synthase